MTTRIKSRITKSAEPRKNPRQDRSRQTRLDLLAGATRVLRQRGASGLTTNRVAEQAGVSVGSLYQYYPNKAALLADLHAEEGNRLWQELGPLLRDNTQPARIRLLCLLEGVFVAQAAAAEHHEALEAEGVDLLATDELTNLGEQFQAELAALLMREVQRPKDVAESEASFCLMTVFGLLPQLAKNAPDEAQTRQLAAQTAAMLSAYLRLP